MSIRETKGVIDKKFEKDWFDKRTSDTIILRSFRLQNDKTYYRTGTEPIPANEGDYVSFEYDDRSGNVVIASMQQLEGEVQTAPAPARRDTGGRTGSYGGGAPKAAGSGGSRDDYWKNKEDRDLLREQRYQNIVEPRMIVMAAQERAVGAVAAALANDCLSFGNMAKGQKFETLLGFVDEATEHFVKQALNAHNLCDEVTDDAPTPRGGAEEPNDD